MRLRYRSKIVATGKLRFIEVKGRVAGALTVTISRNEILTALNKADDFILAVGQVDGGPTEPLHPPAFSAGTGIRGGEHQLHSQDLLGRGEAPYECDARRARCLARRTGSERLEFKEAKTNFHFETLAKYCTALANEGGGKILLGVTDKRPRRVVGSNAFSEPGRTVAGLINRLGIQITSEEIQHANGRVLVFHIPPRPVGMPIQFDGVFWSRAGDELRPLSAGSAAQSVPRIGPDFSAELHPDAGLERFGSGSGRALP